MSKLIDTIRGIIEDNPFLSMLAGSVLTYVAAKYGPAISTVCSTLAGK